MFQKKFLGALFQVAKRQSKCLFWKSNLVSHSLLPAITISFLLFLPLFFLWPVTHSSFFLILMYLVVLSLVTAHPLRCALHLLDVHIPFLKNTLFFLHPVRRVPSPELVFQLVISNLLPSWTQRPSAPSPGQAFVFVMPFVMQVMGELSHFTSHTRPPQRPTCQFFILFVQQVSPLILITRNMSQWNIRLWPLDLCFFYPHRRQN